MCCSVECLGAHISRRTQHVRAGTCLDAIGSTRGRSRSGGDFKHRWAPGWRLNREGTLHPARARPSPLTAGRRGCPLGQGDAAGAGAHTGVRMRDAPPPQLRASTCAPTDCTLARSAGTVTASEGSFRDRPRAPLAPGTAVHTDRGGAGHGCGVAKRAHRHRGGE